MMITASNSYFGRNMHKNCVIFMEKLPSAGGFAPKLLPPLTGSLTSSFQRLRAPCTPKPPIGQAPGSSSPRLQPTPYREFLTTPLRYTNA